MIKNNTYYVEDVDHLTLSLFGISKLKMSISKILNSGKAIEVNIYDDGWCSFSDITLKTLKVLGITLKRKARINEIFRFEIGLRYGDYRKY